MTDPADIEIDAPGRPLWPRERVVTAEASLYTYQIPITAPAYGAQAPHRQLVRLADFADDTDARNLLALAQDHGRLQQKNTDLTASVTALTGQVQEAQRKLDSIKAQVIPLIQQVADSIRSSNPPVAQQADNAVAQLKRLLGTS